jgi:2-polyprenyl-3-methyl-5-hydroxy-6-metoxy-1,4-benzoquinol methylase
MITQDQRTGGPRIAWEDVSCPLCDADAEASFLEAAPPGASSAYRLVRCGCCGLVYMNPRPDEPSIAQFYPAEYEWYHPPVRRETWLKKRLQRLRRLVMSRALGTPPRLGTWSEKLVAALAAPWLRPNPNSMTALRYQGEGRLLDFGCGSGWYAQRMKALGWQVTGMDFNPLAAEQVAQHFDIPVLVGSLPHPEVQPSSYDVITMGAVLEHLHRPHEAIAAAAQALRPGGYLVVSVPNIGGWGFRTFGPDWWGLQLPVHLLHFTPVTLRRMIEMHGLEVRELRMVGQPGWMRRSMATARRQKPARLLSQLGRLRPACSLLTRWSAWSGQADCIQVTAVR